VSQTRHVVLVTYGEPPAAAFVDQLVYSWRILLGLTRTVAPIPAPLVPAIALARAWSRTRSWSAYQYVSPLEPITGQQRDQVAAALAAARADVDWQVHVAYEFRRPLIADVLRRLPQEDDAIVVPMYAADSAFTHALSREVARPMNAGRAGDIHVAGALAVDALAELSAAHVLAQTADAGWRGGRVALVLAAHGTVLDPPAPIDTGLAATQALCDAIATRLAPHFGVIVNGWLNHTRGGRWTEPPIDAALARVAASGCARVVYYPYGFLADNAESQLEGQLALEAISAVESRHLPCLNGSPSLAALIAGQVAAVSRGSAPAAATPAA
jgi:protoheme ferro-lyase